MVNDDEEPQSVSKGVSEDICYSEQTTDVSQETSPEKETKSAKKRRRKNNQK